MSRLSFFESGQGLIAARLGIIQISVLVKYDMYKTYLDFLKEDGNTESARRKTVAKCKCHYSTVARAIYWFEYDESYKAYKELRKARLQIVAQAG